MREGQVRAADQHVDRGAERAQRHRGALGVPARAGPSPTGSARPGRPRRGPPDRDVEDRLPLGGVVLVAVRRARLQRRLGVQAGRSGTCAAAEEDEARRARRPRRAASSAAASRITAARGSGRAGRCVGGGDAQRLHVTVEEELLGQRELVVVPAVRRAAG